MNIDKKQAAQFLTILAESESVTFQTLDDDKGLKRRHLNQIYHGDIDEQFEKLEQLNQQGAGVFAMVNAGDEKGRKAENVQRVRALFVDLDDAPLEPILVAPLEPHIIIESSVGRYHAYWLVQDCPLDKFKHLQSQLATKFEGDKYVNDLPRVMRLPGFEWHKAENGQPKGEPFMTKIYKASSAQPYTLDHIVSTLELEPPQRATSPDRPIVGSEVAPESVERVRSALAYLTSNTNYDDWLKIGMALHDNFSGRGEGLRLFDEWSGNSPNYAGSEDCQKKWESFGHKEGARVTIATLFHLAKKNEWNDPGLSNTRSESHSVIWLDDWIAKKRFVGEPPKREWLIDKIFPMGQPSLLASQGGMGKSYLMLQLAYEVSHYDPLPLKTKPLFGSVLARGGKAVYVTAEDDYIEVANRLKALGSLQNDNLIVVPVPSAGGSLTLFKKDKEGNPSATQQWDNLREQLLQLKPIMIAFDPIQVLSTCDLNLAENAQFIAKSMSGLAADTGAAVIFSHHMRKQPEKFAISSPSQARDAIRGSGGMVDGVRAVYALWAAPWNEVQAIGKRLGVTYRPGDVIYGSLVKSNGASSGTVVTYCRNVNGLLEYRGAVDCDLRDTDLEDALFTAIESAAAREVPFTKTGEHGVHNRCKELPPVLSGKSRNELGALVEKLQRDNRIETFQKDGKGKTIFLRPDTAPFEEEEAA